jgi:aminoglycoside 6'-N-acetyltransferase I
VHPLLRRLDGGVQFVAYVGAGQAAGFAEGSIRSDFVNGTETSPVVFLEGLYVAPALRRRGIARKLVTAVAGWGTERGCREFASDAALGNRPSRRVHRALGFQETERVVYFRKWLGKGR